eukprot:TRINITY_DN240_c0_g1_i6.p1 TRINITY_DN240_c0_g1~~TRINITY_DN240_c0_g1_i6.p1  ORF type:complete len:476 (+),score=76.25 TRINITY_DN240_c0_g1_i6:1317-2744(+)
MVDYMNDESLKPGLIELPTGAGKTLLMLLSPFGGRVRGRVLLITNKSIKQQIWRDVLKLRTLGILAPDQQLPTLVEICEPSNVAQRSAELVELASFVKFASTKSLTECCQVLSEAHIVVTNVAKLAQHSGKSKLLECLAPDAFSLVICDEAHHGFSESFDIVLRHFDRVKKLFFSATFFNSKEDLAVLEKCHTVTSFHYNDALQHGLLKSLKVCELRMCNATLEGETNKAARKQTKQDFLEEQFLGLDKIAQAATRPDFRLAAAGNEELHDAVTNKLLESLAEKRSLPGNVQHLATVVAPLLDACEELAGRIVHNFHQLSEQMRSALLQGRRQFRADFIHSERPDTDQRNVLRDFGAGKIDVLVYVDMLKEGYSNDNISIAAVLKSYRSLQPLAQVIGRTVRLVRPAQDQGPLDPRHNEALLIISNALDQNRLVEHYQQERREPLDTGGKSKVKGRGRLSDVAFDPPLEKLFITE